MLKSIGLVARFFVVSAACVGAVSAHAQQAAEGYHLLASQAGRYVFGWAGGSAKTAMMLDTQTGRAWEVICIVDDLTKPQSDGCKYRLLRPYYFERPNGVSLTPDGALTKPE